MVPSVMGGLLVGLQDGTDDPTASSGNSRTLRPWCRARRACAPDRGQWPDDPDTWRRRMDAAVQPAVGRYTFEERRRRIFAIMAASSGNLVEWFDFYIYAFTSIYFAPSFFPKSDETVQLLQAAAVFAIGFLMRPIGGWMFGKIADRRGRKTSLVISVVMMCIGS